MGRIFLGRPLSCAVNPAAGRETIYRLEPAPKAKKIMVVGGGIAGLEAARAAAVRGHKVTLFEKSKALGGHLIEASVPDFKKDLERLLNWYKLELGGLDVDIRLGVEVTASLIEEEKADATIIATGSKSRIPDIPGINLDHVATDIDLFLGKKKGGKRVLIVGGGLIGCETALWLAQQGKKVTIVEQLSGLMIARKVPVPHANRIMLLDLLQFHKVEVLTGYYLEGITKEGGDLMSQDFKRKKVEADTVGISIGLEPCQALYDAVAGKVPNLYLIGDAREVRNVMGSIWDAYEVARAI